MLLLLLGLGSAVVIYFVARPAEANPLGDPLMNKKYVRELRVWGGKSNVMAAEFMDWFRARWQGQELATTVAVLTVAATLAFRFVAARPEFWRDPPTADPTPPSGAR